MVKLNRKKLRVFACSDCGSFVSTRSPIAIRCRACATLVNTARKTLCSRKLREKAKREGLCPMCMGERDSDNIYCSWCTRIRQFGNDPGPEPFTIDASWNGRPYRRR